MKKNKIQTFSYMRNRTENGVTRHYNLTFWVCLRGRGYTISNIVVHDTTPRHIKLSLNSKHIAYQGPKFTPYKTCYYYDYDI